jgi:NAD(P) transhydrogenase
MNRQLEYAGVTYKEGLASFPDSGGTKSLILSKMNNAIETVSVENILLATGSKPFRPAGVPFDGKRVFDSDSINQVRPVNISPRLLSYCQCSSSPCRIIINSLS